MSFVFHVAYTFKFKTLPFAFKYNVMSFFQKDTGYWFAVTGYIGRKNDVMRTGAVLMLLVAYEKEKEGLRPVLV